MPGRRTPDSSPGSSSSRGGAPANPRRIEWGLDALGEPLGDQRDPIFDRPDITNQGYCRVHGHVGMTLCQWCWEDTA